MITLNLIFLPPCAVKIRIFKMVVRYCAIVDSSSALSFITLNAIPMYFQSCFDIYGVLEGHLIFGSRVAQLQIVEWSLPPES